MDGNRFGSARKPEPYGAHIAVDVVAIRCGGVCSRTRARAEKGIQLFCARLYLDGSDFCNGNGSRCISAPVRDRGVALYRADVGLWADTARLLPCVVYCRNAF